MKKLLIVDDDEDFATLLEEILSSTNVAVNIDHCIDASSALQKIDEQPVDMLILDYNLPAMNGLEIVEKLHEKNMFPQVIMITGYSDQIMRERARELDITAFLEKPFDIRVLDFYVHKCLSSS
jgi:DNA-binding response OmpR family regulator